MKPLILAVLGLGLAAFPALAQEQAPPPLEPGVAAAPMGDEALPPPPPGGKPGPREAGPGPKGPRMGGPRDGRDGPPPPPKGAQFRLESGDNKIDVKCADDEPMQACADIVFRMLDRFSPATPGAAPVAPPADAPAASPTQP